MIVTLPCGHTVDDLHVDTVCYGDKGHYPLNASPAVYCKKHDQFHPDCDKPEPVYPDE
jgi:hypothetical protein